MVYILIRQIFEIPTFEILKFNCILWFHQYSWISLILTTNSNVHLSATSLITYCTYWIISANFDFHLIHEILYPRILIKPRSESLICTIDSIMILLHDLLCTLYFIILIFVNKFRESSNKYLIFTAYLYTCILACLPDNQRITPPPSLFFLFNIHSIMFHCVDVDITYNCTCWFYVYE